MRPDLVIFDLDGTLVDSIGGIAFSANHVLKLNGYPTHEVDDYRKLIGHGVRGTITNALPDGYSDQKSLDRMVEEFRAFYSRNYLVDTKLYPGVSEMLNQLEALGIPFAINTNKHASISYPIIEALFGKWQLIGYYGPDENIAKKPDPMAAKLLLEKAGARPEGSYYIGDSEVDVATAINAGMKSVWVSWGYREAESIVDEPHVLVNSPDDIMRIIQK